LKLTPSPKCLVEHHFESHLIAAVEVVAGIFNSAEACGPSAVCARAG
jgi:hypothetical protein